VDDSSVLDDVAPLPVLHLVAIDILPCRLIAVVGAAGGIVNRVLKSVAVERVPAAIVPPHGDDVILSDVITAADLPLVDSAAPAASSVPVLYIPLLISAVTVRAHRAYQVPAGQFQRWHLPGVD